MHEIIELSFDEAKVKAAKNIVKNDDKIIYQS